MSYFRLVKAFVICVLLLYVVYNCVLSFFTIKYIYLEMNRLINSFIDGLLSMAAAVAIWSGSAYSQAHPPVQGAFTQTNIHEVSFSYSFLVGIFLVCTTVIICVSCCYNFWEGRLKGKKV